MKKIYTHENRFIVWNAKNILENEGITCVVQNEYASSGIGDLSPFETWPELWILDDAETERATLILEEAFHAPRHRRAWRCPKCHEINGPAFEICWQCGE